MNVVGYPLGVMHHYELAGDGLGRLPPPASRAATSTGSRASSASPRAAARCCRYGAVVLQEIVAAMKPSKIVVSALGVREGFLYSLLPPEEQRGRSADLGRRRSWRCCARAR